MEEQHTPVHEDPVIVASNKKHSWSKKEKIALSVAGVIVLVGLGFGGLTFYNQVILNAAGEESLGSDVVVDLPAANESPYFKIAWVSQQDVGILPTGEASDCWMTTAFKQEGCDFASGWRVEQSSNPADETSWKEVYARDGEADNKSAECGVASIYYPSTVADPIVPVLSSSLRRVSNGHGDACPMIRGPLAYSNEAFMQPDTDYYFRVSRKVASTASDGTPSTSWQVQGPAVAARTKAYPEASFKQDKNQLVFSWTGASGIGMDIQDYEFTILRSTNPRDFTDASITNWDEYREKQQNNRGLYDIDVNRVANTDFTAGQKTITQDPNTVYYYALGIWDGNYNDGGVVYRLLSDTYVASTDTTASTTPIVNLSIAPRSVPANKLDTIKLTASLKDSCIETFGGCDWEIHNITRLNNYPNGASDRGITAYSSSNTDPSVTVSSDRRSITMSPLSSKISKNTYWNNVTDALPGSYTLGSTFVVNTDAAQTVQTPITLTKVIPSLSATYKAATVKYKSNVVINIKNAYPENYSVLPSGKIIVKNLNTKKTIKTISLSDYQTSRTITLKGVKKGKYNLAIIFQADSKKGIFEDQTINLPKLTVK